LKYSQDILTFIPNDYSALYYEAYVKNKQGQPKALNDFYESTNDEKTTKELENVVKHILTHFVLTHYNKANAFMKRESPQTCDELNRLYKERIQKEEDYAVVPRQVFICHKSEDFDVVRKVSDAIEKDGNKCWYSERNLRPNDGQNYWKNIEEAIDNATIFLVISSDISMKSVDVQRELQYANKKNKKKIEYKIDDSVHTLLFKHSFDGIKWIDGKNSKELEVLKERVFELLNEKEPVKEEPKVENKSKLINLIKKMYYHIEFEEYDEANKIIKLIREDDFEQLDSWMGEFLIDNKLKDINSLISMINDISTLEKLNSIKESKSFKSLKKHDVQQNYRDVYNKIDSQSEKLINRFVFHHKILTYKINKPRNNHT
jgi:protein-arginine kinase activator protein McsA